MCPIFPRGGNRDPERELALGQPPNSWFRAYLSSPPSLPILVPMQQWGSQVGPFPSLESGVTQTSWDPVVQPSSE